MPLEGHPEDCACCVVRIDRRGGKRARADADLENFLPPEPEVEEAEGDLENFLHPEPEVGEAEGEAEGEGEGEEEFQENVEDEIISSALFAKFDEHVLAIQRARAARQELLCFKSALEEDAGKAKIDADASLDEVEGLGVWQPGDDMQGDVNMRTLSKLLTRVDQRGFERYTHANLLRFKHPLRTASLLP